MLIIITILAILRIIKLLIKNKIYIFCFVFDGTRSKYCANWNVQEWNKPGEYILYYIITKLKTSLLRYTINHHNKFIDITWKIKTWLKNTTYLQTSLKATKGQRVLARRCLTSNKQSDLSILPLVTLLIFWRWQFWKS